MFWHGAVYENNVPTLLSRLIRRDMTRFTSLKSFTVISSRLSCSSADRLSLFLFIFFLRSETYKINDPKEEGFIPIINEKSLVPVAQRSYLVNNSIVL